MGAVKPWVALVASTTFAASVGLGVLYAPLSPPSASEVPDQAAAEGRDRGTDVTASAGQRDVAGASSDVDGELAGCEPASLATRAGAVLVVGLPGVTTAAPGDGDLAEPIAAAQQARVAGVFLTSANVRDRTQVTALVDDLRARLGADLLVATDEETGRVSGFRHVLGETRSPRSSAANTDVDAWRRRSRLLARELAAVGVNWNFAPVADLDDGAHQQVIGDRSFSADAEVATRYALAFATGHARSGVIPTIKHFPGHGGLTADPHYGPVHDDTPLRTLRRHDLEPFVAAIERGASAVMTSHVTHEAFDTRLPASLTPAVYELLRDLGFGGVAITDSVGMGAVHQRWDYAESAPRALAAGADAVLATDGNAAPIMAAAIVEAVEDGDLEAARLDEAATRVLTLAGRDPEPVTCRPVPEDFPAGLGSALPADRP